VDQDGNEDGELQAGTSCAARRSGRRAGEIRAEAKAADHAARGAWMLHREAQNRVEMDVGDRILARKGLQRSLDTWDAWAKDPEFITELAAWNTAHPAPARPKGW
jgi:hypothetical protein